MIRMADIQKQIKIKLKYLLDVYNFEHRSVSLADWLWPIGLFIGSNLIAYHFFNPKLMLIWLFIITVALLIIGFQVIQNHKYDQKASQTPQIKRFWKGGSLDVPLNTNAKILKEKPAWPTRRLGKESHYWRIHSERRNFTDFRRKGTSKVASHKREGRAPGSRYALGHSVKYSEDALDFRKSLLKSDEEETSRIEEIPKEKWRDWHISSDIRSQVIPRPKGEEEPKLVFLKQKFNPRQKMELQEQRRKAKWRSRRRSSEYTSVLSRGKNSCVQYERRRVEKTGGKAEQRGWRSPAFQAYP